MSVEEIKRSLAALSLEEQRHISAYLGALRRAADPEHQAEIQRALASRDPADWMTLEQLENRLREHGVTDETL